MEDANKKNMALKLENWLSAKQAGQRPPLRPVNQTISSQRRASGHHPAATATESPTGNRKPFSKARSSSDDGDSSHLPTSVKAANSPVSPLTVKVGMKSPSTRNSRQSFTFDHIHDESSKENQPLKDKNIKLSMCKKTKIPVTPSNNQTCESSGVNNTQLHLELPNLNNSVLPVVVERSEECISKQFDESDVIPDVMIVLKDNDETIENSKLLCLNPSFSEIIIEDDGSCENQQIHNKYVRATEELHAMMFLNSIQEQKINELEQIISKDRLEQNETSLSRGKKHKAEVKKLASERASYEERANQMISDMGEQMGLLQSMAMTRIEVLENDLMSERHRVEALSQEAITLKAASKAQEASYSCRTCEANKLLAKNRRKSVYNERNFQLQIDSNDGFDSDPDCSSVDETVHASDDEGNGGGDGVEDEFDEDAEGNKIVDEKYEIDSDNEELKETLV